MNSPQPFKSGSRKYRVGRRPQSVSASRRKIFGVQSGVAPFMLAPYNGESREKDLLLSEMS